MTHRWKQLRDRDYNLWIGIPRLVKFQILYTFVWTMTCHKYYMYGWKSGNLEEMIHSEFHPLKNPSDCDVYVKYQKRLDLFWNHIEIFTRYSTACRCLPYCEVKLRPIAHIRPASHLCAWPVECWIFVLINILLNFALKYWFGATKILTSSLKRLVAFAWNGTAGTSFFTTRFRVSSREKSPTPSAFFTSSSLYLLSDLETLVWTPLMWSIEV